MTEQPFLHRILGHQREGGSWAPTSRHRGRLSSWLAVGITCAGLVVIGVSIIVWPAGILLTVGLALVAAGGVVGAIADIFTDVVLDSPHEESEEPHSTPLHRIKSTEGQIEREE